MSSYFYSFNYKWYYLLNGRTDKNVYLRGLLDDNPDTENKLLICAQPEPDKRYFCLFESYLDFIDYYKTIDDKNKHFYEVIMGNLSQKIHFDLDFEVSQNGTVELNDKTIVNSENILELTINSIITVLSENNVKLDIPKDLLIYTSHGSDKRSFHIVINNYCHSNNLEARKFFNLVFEKLPENIKNTKFVDNSVYSIKQQFRILYSSKAGKNRPKKLEKTFILNNKQYTHIYPINMDKNPEKKEQLEFLYSIEESLISVTSNCVFLPNFGVEVDSDKKNNNYNMGKNINSDMVLDNNLINLCMDALARKFNTHNIGTYFKINKVQSGMIILQKRIDYNCLICLRNHSSENPLVFLTVYGQCYYYCRRAGSKLMIGYIDLDPTKIQNDEITLLNKLITGPVPEIKKEERTDYIFYQGNSGSTEKKDDNKEQIVKTEITFGNIWNKNIMDSLNEVASLTIKEKPKKYIIDKEEVSTIFENTSLNKCIEKEDTSEIDNLWG